MFLSGIANKTFKHVIWSGSRSDYNPLKYLKMGWDYFSTHIWESIKETLLLLLAIIFAILLKKLLKCYAPSGLRREGRLQKDYD